MSTEPFLVLAAAKILPYRSKPLVCSLYSSFAGKISTLLVWLSHRYPRLSFTLPPRRSRSASTKSPMLISWTTRGEVFEGMVSSSSHYFWARFVFSVCLWLVPIAGERWSDWSSGISWRVPHFFSRNFVSPPAPWAKPRPVTSSYDQNVMYVSVPPVGATLDFFLRRSIYRLPSKCDGGALLTNNTVFALAL